MRIFQLKNQRQLFYVEKNKESKWKNNHTIRTLREDHFNSFTQSCRRFRRLLSSQIPKALIQQAALFWNEAMSPAVKGAHIAKAI